VLTLPRERGQGLVEYALIIILVVLVVILILTLIGADLSNMFSRIASSIP
jgi:pilus assembly protein Flp/PilA